MCAVPIAASVIDKRKYYRKGDVIGFLDSDGATSLMDALCRKHREANEGAIARAKREYYHARWVRNLQEDIAELNEWLVSEEWPLGPDTEDRLHEYSNACRNLQEAGRKIPRPPDDAWWVIEDPEQRDQAHRKAYQKYLRETISSLQRNLETFTFVASEWAPLTEPEVLERAKANLRAFEEELERIS
ncbi:hypothetical protein LLG90_08290 [Aromatoleum toluclasticum]|uniref:hypothetical protein n=1 Tax=Aromatoleum toluclasticum TaxID=92003 RepID=UPI001D197D30|nr:hypothetical protein [Aromatoleum toluclasticum]MCC4115343.1 hypothetical protein [Aromatoleum toluclasticum]